MNASTHARAEIGEILRHASRVDSGLVLWGTFDTSRDAIRIVAAEMHRGQVFNARYRATEFLLSAEEWLRFRLRDDLPRFGRQLGFRLSQAFCLIRPPGDD